MDKIDSLIDGMKNLYEELSSEKIKNVSVEDLKKLRDFSRGYAADIQELIYDIDDKKS